MMTTAEMTETIGEATRELTRLKTANTVLTGALIEALAAFKPFAHIEIIEDEDGRKEPFIVDAFRDCDGVDIRWEPDLPFAPLTVGQFRRAATAYDRAKATLAQFGGGSNG